MIIAAARIANQLLRSLGQPMIGISAAAANDVTGWVLLAGISAYASAQFSALDLGFIPQNVFTMLVIMVVVTTVMTGPLLRALLPRAGYPIPAGIEA